MSEIPRFQTQRDDSGEIIDKGGKPLKKVAWRLRHSQTLQHNIIEGAQRRIGKADNTIDRYKRFQRTGELLIAGVAPHSAHIPTQEEEVARDLEHKEAWKAKDEAGLEKVIATSRYKEDLWNAHEHFIENGGNQGPYVDVAIEDDAVMVEKHGQPPVNR